MKSVASLLAGTALAVTMLLGGVVVASAVLVPREDVPRFTGLDVKDLWTLTPVKVDPQRQAYERLPPRYGSQVVMASTVTKSEVPTEPQVASGLENLDIASTGAVTDIETQDAVPITLPEPHVAWCHARYKSYSADDNSYNSYGGDTRICSSPYLGPSPVDETEGAGDKGEAILVQRSAEGGSPVAMSSAHAQNCLQRYRSYRPEDNSYQPYGGGPRKQCELRSF